MDNVTKWKPSVQSFFIFDFLQNTLKDMQNLFFEFVYVLPCVGKDVTCLPGKHIINQEHRIDKVQEAKKKERTE